VNRRVAALLVALSALIVVVGLVRLFAGRDRADTPAPGPTEPGGETPPAATETVEAILWLPSESGRLAPLPAVFQAPPEAQGRATALLEELFAVVPEPPLDVVFPEPVEVARLLLIEQTAYVDLRPTAGGEPPSTGSTVELLRVYSIVHTLVHNLPEVSRVVLLWNGVQRPALSGHVDTGHPLVPLAALEPLEAAATAQPSATP